MPCDSSCTSCMNCFGGAEECTCAGGCDDGSSPQCVDGGANGPQCECENEDGDEEGDPVFTSVWGLFALMWTCCWIVRCTRAGHCRPSAASQSQVATRFRVRQAEREQQEALLAQAVIAIAGSSRRALHGNSQPEAQVVQAVPVQPTAAPVHAIVVGVDESVDPAMSTVQVAEPAVQGVLPQAIGASNGRHTLRCTQCRANTPQPSGNFCSNCGAAFGSE